MSKECDIIRDLLPLYADDVVSDASREIIEDHLPGCPDCREYLKKIRDNELEHSLRDEKNAVIEYGAKKFKRQSAAFGSAVSGAFTIPILALLGISLLSELRMSWFFVVLAALGVAASLIVVPLVVKEDRLFWTFCAFCASLILLLAVTCIYVRGDWFWVASSATLFGLSVVFLPFVLRARPVKKLIGNANRLLVVLGVDAVLFVSMIYTITHRNRFGSLVLAMLACAAIILLQGMKNRHAEK